jgi:hypothetical protein
MDALIIWVGQHGSSNHPLPMLDSEESAAKGNRRTKPHDWEAYYCSYFMVSINAWRDMDPINHEEIYLNADARNVQKMRDLHWPWRHPTLAQYDLKKDLKFDRGTDPAFWVRNPPWNRVAREISNPNVWQADVYCVYSRLEINSLSPIAPFGQMAVYNDQWDGRKSFGIFINEARPSVKDPELVRGPIVKRWVMPLKPNFIHGKWSDSGQKLLGREVYPLPWDEYFPALHAVRSTLTTPSSGSGWATTKPWEAFAAGTVCFFHPNYDTQGHILKDAPEELRKYLRVLYPDQLERRVKEMNEDRDKWGHMVKLQREHFDKAITRLDYAQMIMDRLDRKAKPVVGEVDSDVEARAQNA